MSTVYLEAHCITLDSRYSYQSFQRHPDLIRSCDHTVATEQAHWKARSGLPILIELFVGSYD